MLTYSILSSAGTGSGEGDGLVQRHIAESWKTENDSSGSTAHSRTTLWAEGRDITQI